MLISLLGMVMLSGGEPLGMVVRSISSFILPLPSIVATGMLSMFSTLERVKSIS